MSDIRPQPSGSAPDRDGRLRQSGLEIAGERSHGGRDPFHGKKFRWWFFTWNNPAHPVDKSRILAAGYTYCNFQLERGEQGTPHYQGVFYIADKSAARPLLRKIPYSYLAPVRSVSGAINYTGKAETRIDGPWSYGKVPRAGQGSRSDLEEVKAAIDSGAGMDRVWSEHFSSCVRYHRGFEKYHGIVHRDDVRRWPTTLYVYHGLAGTGKTQAAMEEARVFGGGTYWLTLEKGNGGKVWWDGYCGQANVIIDEFGCQIPFSEFKRLIDATPLAVPIKGGFTQFLAKRVWILSNLDVNVFYYKALSTDAMRQSLWRRLHYIELFSERFQGQPDYESFLFSRSQFVEAQRAGEYKIKIN